jgi:SagB-type dehydrogenase family enzyme
MAAYKSNPHVKAYPEYGETDPAFTLEHLPEKRTFRLENAELLGLLDYTTDWTDRADIEAYLVDELGYTSGDAADLVEQFAEFGLLCSRDAETQFDSPEVHAWSDAGWQEALDFYLYIRNISFISDELDEATMSAQLQFDHEKMVEYAAEEALPPNYRDYEDAPVVDLPDVEGDGELGSFADAVGVPHDLADPDDPLTKPTLSRLLFYACGKTGTIDFGQPQGEKLLKAVPSGGARHPVEAYLAVFDVEGVESGLYHYSVRDHALERLDDADTAREVAAGVYDFDRAGFEPSVAVFYSAVVLRSMWRYREPRTYRVINHDVGHVFETMDLVAAAETRPSLFGVDYDTSIPELFGLDEFEEPLFGYSLVG